MANISDFGLDGVRASVAFYSMRQQNTEKMSEKILYDFLNYTCQSIWDVPAQLDSSLHLSHERESFLQNPMEHLLQYTVLRYSSFGADAIKDTKDLIRQFLVQPDEPRKRYDNHELKNVTPDTFFKAVCTYGMARELDSAIKSEILCMPEHMIKAYPQWRRENDALFQIGKKGLPSTGELIATTLGKIAGENNHPTAKLIADYKRLGTEATDERIKKLYQDLIILADPFSAPLAVDAGLYQGLRPTFKSFFASITGIHKHLNDQERTYVRDTLVTYMGPVPTGVDAFASMLDKRPETVATIRHRMMGVIADAVSPINLFQSLHLYGVENDFMGAVERGDVPEKTAKAYPKWKKESKAFVGKYAQPAAKDYAAVPEEIALFQQAEALSAVTPIVSRLLKSAGDELIDMAQSAVGNMPAQSHSVRLQQLLNEMITIAKQGLGENDYKSYVRKISTNSRNLFELANTSHDLFSSDETLILKGVLRGLILPPKEKITDSVRVPAGNGKAGFTTAGQQSYQIMVDAFKVMQSSASVMFRSIHIFNLLEEFEGSCKCGFIPKEIRAAYKNWEKVNSQFIWDRYKINTLRAHIANFASDVGNAKDLESKKFYEMFRMYASVVLSPDQPVECDRDIVSDDEFANLQKDWRAGIIKLVVNSQHIILKDGMTIPYFKDIEFLGVYADQNEVEKHPLNTLDVSTYFEFIKFVDAEEELKKLLSTNKFPHIKFSDYETWAKTGHMPVTVEVIETPITVDSRVTYIDVDHPLVTRGKRDEGMGYRPVDEGDQLDAGAKDENPDRNRTEKIKDALLQDAASGVRHLTIRRDVRQMDCKSGRPYHLIDVDMEDGSRSRIAVCDFVGNMTFVERDAPDYIDGQTLDLEALRKNPKTWHVAHISDKQFIDGIQEVLYTPLDTMSPALKNKSYWYSLGDVAVQSLVTKFMIAGRAPTTVDTKTLIDCGPLEGRSKYNLLYSAWNRGSIKGFEKGTTFSIVLKSLTEGDDATMPWLKKFENKPQITTETILAASERFNREWGFAAQQGFYDELKIDAVDARVKPTDDDLRRTGIEADIAFKFRAVAVNDNDLQKWGRYPDSLDDFMNLARVVPAPVWEIA